MASNKIRVAVRVRPFNSRELQLGTECVVTVNGQQIFLHNPNSIDKDRKTPKSFTFDHCFFSTETHSPIYASQADVFDSIGQDILEKSFQGYNACIFAYGQTGSGKSYTMMGAQDNESKGIIPRLCDQLFATIANQQSLDQSYRVEVSYMEIYNEKVHDLLDPKLNKQSLKVREHNVLGPYVDGLSQLAVSSFSDIDSLMTEGNKSRTVAATNMNAESSRSHAVFSVILNQTLTDLQTGVSGEKVSRISLVDLAGSERATKTGAVGDRLKEGSNINKSLTTLGLVISKLSDQSSGKNRNDKFVPYRDSVLTWLLKDNLGGNSKTVMLATISPSSDNFEETLSTLRYANRAKKIVNHAVVNEDPNARIIRELRLEVETLREMLKHATISPVEETQRDDIHVKLAESENLMKQISQTWEEKLVKTERIQNKRQQALEQMGISVQASGIKVEKDKYYLVNLNADPSLNELLVYYLKEHTLVGGKSFTQKLDIQLSGLGIQAEHCVISIENGDLFMAPINSSRCFVNGSPVIEKILLHNGDRILWGNHHFFRVNCPRNMSSEINASEPQTPAQAIDYNFARDELMQNELSNDPIKSAIERLEKQHEEDKQVALEKQRQEYERQFQQLRNILSPSTPYGQYVQYDPLKMGKNQSCISTSQMSVEKWAQEQDEMFKRSLRELKTDIMKANTYVQEANFLAEEMKKKTKFSVTLQIPPANLSPNRRRGAFVSEPAIMVRQPMSGRKIWNIEKLENKLIDMREMYQDYKERIVSQTDDLKVKSMDPFYETSENHSLIGVANIFLEVLCHDVTLDYHTPIINQQGEVAGRLQVEVSRISGQMPKDRFGETASESSFDSRDEDGNLDALNSQITCRIKIKQAIGIPLALSNFVFCRYTFWNHPDVVVPVLPSALTQTQSKKIKFNHSEDFTVSINEEFLEHCAEGALSIEVWGHRSSGFSKSKGWEVEQQQAKAHSLIDCWSELSRKIELWVEIQELNDNGLYTPVEVSNRLDVLTGGVYQLRQGQQRRVQVRVKPVHNSGTLPIICQSIINIAIGSVTIRSRLQKLLDSYQEEDLTVLREKWSEALGRRRQYLDQQIQKLVNKEDKTDEEKEREMSLVSQWVSLTEERNAVLVPAPGSGIPGAPASWDPPAGMEPHVPVLFLDLNANDLSAQNTREEVPLVGLHSILPKEHGNKFYGLQVLQHLETDVAAIASWDSSLHDCQALNRVTEANERIYLILKTTVRLSHPAPMDLVLRKRIALNVYKRQSITERIKKFRLGKSDSVVQTGVTYEVVSNIPTASEELEDRESLAQLAASGEDCSAIDGETYIEKYTRVVSAVESLLTLDRLRQNVAVKELEQSVGQLMLMRKTVSVPNFSQLMSFDTSMDSLNTAHRSESFADLKNSEFGMNRSFHGTTAGQQEANYPAAYQPQDMMVLSRKSMIDECMTSSGGEPYGKEVARPTFLNLNINLNSLRLQQPNKPSPVSTKLGVRMTTLHEEPIRHRSLVEECEDNLSDSEITEEQIENSTNMNASRPLRLLTSRTMDSLSDIRKHRGMSHSLADQNINKITSPILSSSSSSGYGSQTFSSGNLLKDIDDALTPCTTKASLSQFNVAGKNMPKRENPFLKQNKTSQKSDGTETELSGGGYDEITQPESVPNGKLDLEKYNNSHEQCNNDHVNEKEVDALDEDEEEHCDEEELDGDEEDGEHSGHSERGTEQERNDDEEMYDKQNGNDENRNIFSYEFVENGEQQQQQHNIDAKNESAENDNNKMSTANTTITTTTTTANATVHSHQNNVQSKSRTNNSSSDKMSTMSKSVSGVNFEEQCNDKIVHSVPEWMTVGESVLVRPYNTTGLITFIGGTHFQGGTWIGVALDTPTGKNDGSLQGKQYFKCKPKHGIFVRPEKLNIDKRGRAMRAYQSAEENRGDVSISRARSQGEIYRTLGTTKK